MSPKLDRSTSVVRRTMLLMVGLLAAYIVGWAIYIGEYKSRLYAAGRAAAMSGQWSEAFVQFHALVELDPGYGDARNQLDQIIPSHASCPWRNECQRTSCSAALAGRFGRWGQVG